MLPRTSIMRGCRAYFDVDENNRLSQDTEGDELADREAARREALLTLAQMAGTLPGPGRERRDHHQGPG